MYRPDATIEALAFAFLIAPELGISIRFFGSEPSCQVTREYARQSEIILSLAGIRSRTLPRLEHDGRPVSASHVRGLLQAGDYAAIASLVPQSTLAYLTSHQQDDSFRTA